jgi:hypothetical protein
MRVQTQTTKDKISKSLMGHIVSGETRKKIAKKSVFQKGFTPWNKGKSWPEEIRRKISLTNKTKGIEPKVKFIGCGENSTNWKGGITTKNNLERGLFRRTIQKMVFERDNYTCQLCGVSGTYIQVDHIQSWKDYVEGRFDINNCRTLCQKCHYEITFGKPMPKNIKTWGHNFKQL